MRNPIDNPRHRHSRISAFCWLCLTCLVACVPAPPPEPTARSAGALSPTPTPSLPAPTPAPTLIPPASAPTPTAGRTVWTASISPDGQWLAQSMAEFPDSQGTYRTQLKVIKRDGSVGWSTAQEAPIALGYTTPQPLHWSRDAHYLYFTNRPAPDGCSMFVDGSDLWRIDLSTGQQVQLMPAQAWSLALSPDERTLAYVAQGRPLRLVLRDLQTGAERQTTLQVENDAFAGLIVWSPDASALAFTLADNSCRTSQWKNGVMQVAVSGLAQTVLIPNDARLLQTVEWAEPDNLLLRDKDGQRWWLNPTTRQLAVASLPEETIDAARWPAFHSDALGISLNYPPAWEVTEDHQIVYLWTGESFGGGPEPIRYYVYIGDYPNPQGRPFVEVATGPWSETIKRTFTFTPTTIGNYQAYETTNIPSRSGALTVFFEGDKRYVAVALTPYDGPPLVGQDKYVRLFRALLQTVRLAR